MGIAYEDFLNDLEQSDNAADASLIVRFSIERKLDATKTGDDGEPVYKPVEYITIIAPGDRRNVIHRPIMKSDTIRFASRYGAWKQSAKELDLGTPLKGLDLFPAQQVAEMATQNILTVEQLANLPDGVAGQIMGGFQLKQKAARYLQAAKEKAPAIKFAKELESRDAQIAALQDQLAKLAERLDDKGKKG